MYTQLLVFLTLLLHIFVPVLRAQTTNGSEIIRALNPRIAAVEKGVFTIDARFKFADGEDTLAHRGTCYFFRKSNPDSLAPFVVISEEKPVFAFDGENFYQEAGPEMFWVTAVKDVGGLRRMLRGNVKKSNLIYEPLLRVDRPNLRPGGFDSVELTAARLNDLPMLRLTVRDTSIEEALGDVANNKIIAAYHWDIAIPDFYLARVGSEVWLFDGWQYEEKLFSPITPLPDKAQFSDYFNPDKLAATFSFEQHDPNAPVKREQELIQAGATLPDFILSDLQGQTYSASEQQQGLLLLDFWYKGCFPCQMAMPKLENLHQKYASKGLQVLGINPFDKNNDALKEWLKTRKVTYNTLFDPEKNLPKAVGIIGYPLLIIADAKTKKVLHVHSGFSEELEAELEPILVKHLKK